MRRTELLQEIQKMRFKEAYEGWHAGELTQIEAARLLGIGYLLSAVLRVKRASEYRG